MINDTSIADLADWCGWNDDTVLGLIVDFVKSTKSPDGTYDALLRYLEEIRADEEIDD